LSSGRRPDRVWGPSSLAWTVAAATMKQVDRVARVAVDHLLMLAQDRQIPHQQFQATRLL
jgi:hypothetical protein